MLDQSTKRKIDNARDILVGKVPDPKSQVEQITIALIYKFMDDMDKEAEEWGGKPTFFTDEYKKYAWSNIFDPRLGGFDLIALYGDAIVKMNQNPNIPQLFRDIFKNAYLPYRDPETLKSFLKEINEFTYDHSEQLGDAFEYLLSVMDSQGDAGQFRTPRHIIDFIVEIVAPKKNEMVLDPACGTAGFLISSYKHILKSNTKDRNGDQLTPEERKRLLNNFMGYDISPDMVRLSLVNLYLHGFSDPKIAEYDTLTSEEKWNDTADVMLANPPFMTPKGGIRPHKRFSIQAKRSEVLFVDYIAEHLNPHGRAGVIVPEGIIFQSQTAYKNLRKMLVEDYLWAVVSLPAGLFQPYSGVKTSILLMDKTLAKNSDKILFVKIDSDGFNLGAQRRPIDKNDLPKALEFIKDCHKKIMNGEEVKETDFAHLVEKNRIAKSRDWNLSGERYRIIDKIRLSDYELDRLKNVCELLGGFAFKSAELDDVKTQDNQLPVIKIGNLTKNGKLALDKVQYFKYNESLKKYLIKKDDVLIAMTGATVGKVAVSNQDNLLLNQRVGISRAYEEKLDKKYLSALLLNERFYDYCQIAAGGGAQGNISPTQILNYQIPLPPLDVQKAIVAEIEGYQKILDGARQVVDNYKPTIKIDPDWEMVALGKLAQNLDGKRIPISKSERKSGIYPYYGASGIVDYVYDYIFDDDLLLISEDGANLLARVSPIAFSVSGKCWVNNHAHVLKFENKATQIFVEVYLNSISLEYYITGSAQPKLNQAKLNSIPIPLPHLSVQQEIVSQIESEQEIVNANKKLIEMFEQKIKDKISEVWGE